MKNGLIDDIPNKLLTPANQAENIKGAGSAAFLIESLVENHTEFPDLEHATVWLLDALETINSAWRTRNRYWAKDYPEYDREWKDLAGVKQRNGVILLKTTLETLIVLEPRALPGPQVSLLREALQRIENRVIKKQQKEVRSSVSGSQIHENWRKTLGYAERWKPSDARLDDGTKITNQITLQRYFEEIKLPPALRAYINFRPDEKTGMVGLQEDIQNLEFRFLSPANQTFNFSAGAMAVTVVDRLWDDNLKYGRSDDHKLIFKDLDGVERWLIAAAQILHRSFLEEAKSPLAKTSRWLNLNSADLKKDLDQISAALEARFTLQPDGIANEQKELILTALTRLKTKIDTNPEIKSCVRGLGRLK